MGLSRKTINHHVVERRRRETLIPFVRTRPRWKDDCDSDERRRGHLQTGRGGPFAPCAYFRWSPGTRSRTTWCRTHLQADKRSLPCSGPPNCGSCSGWLPDAGGVWFKMFPADALSGIVHSPVATAYCNPDAVHLNNQVCQSLLVGHRTNRRSPLRPRIDRGSPPIAGLSHVCVLDVTASKPLPSASGTAFTRCRAPVWSNRVSSYVTSRTPKEVSRSSEMVPGGQ